MKATLLLALAACAGPLAHSQPLQAGDFAWQAQVAAPPGAGFVRVPLPAEALMRLQSPAAADLRVFDGEGRPVAFSLAPPPAEASAPPQYTAAFNALPLFDASARPAKSALKLRVTEAGSERALWVDLNPGAAPQRGTRRLPSVLFDTRAEKRALTALVLQAELAPNRPLALMASTSEDLASWTPVPLRGRLYRFDGEGAPANDTLQLDSPLELEGRYLRLDWSAAEAATVRTLTGLIAAASPAPPRVIAPLPAPRTVDGKALEWRLDFATPLVQLELETSRAETVMPVRVLGRGAPSQPWREMARTVVWRVGPRDAQATSPALPLDRAPVRWLRVEATHGLQLEGVPLVARAVFEPVQIVFAAGSKPPYTVAAGRADAASAALPLGMLLAAAQGGRVESLPVATLQPAVVQVPGALASAAAQWLPAGIEARSLILWAVLGGGVLVLGAAAFLLMRRLPASGGGAGTPD